MSEHTCMFSLHLEVLSSGILKENEDKTRRTRKEGEFQVVAHFTSSSSDKNLDNTHNTYDTHLGLFYEDESTFTLIPHHSVLRGFSSTFVHTPSSYFSCIRPRIIETSVLARRKT